jgi:hypothetical protein
MLKQQMKKRFTHYVGSRPKGLNPFISVTPPGAKRDYKGWVDQASQLAVQRSRAAAFKRAQARALAPADPPLGLSEDEPRGERGRMIRLLLLNSWLGLVLRLTLVRW